MPTHEQELRAMIEQARKVAAQISQGERNFQRVVPTNMPPPRDGQLDRIADDLERIARDIEAYLRARGPGADAVS